MNRFDEIGTRLYLTPGEVARDQGMSEDSVKTAIRRGFLRGERLESTGRWRILFRDYSAWAIAGAPNKLPLSRARERKPDRRVPQQTDPMNT